jgi:hypothetical protein
VHRRARGADPTLPPRDPARRGALDPAGRFPRAGREPLGGRGARDLGGGAGAQVYTLFRATLSEPGFEAGPESLEVGLFELDALPFGELAFPVVEVALRLFVDDRARDEHHLHLGHMVWSREGSRFDAANYELVDHLRVPLEGGVHPGPGSALWRPEGA